VTQANGDSLPSELDFKSNKQYLLVDTDQLSEDNTYDLKLIYLMNDKL